MKKRKEKADVQFFRNAYTITCDEYVKLYKQLKLSRINAADMQQTGQQLHLTVPFFNAAYLVRLCRKNGYKIEKKSDGEFVKAAKWLLHRPALIISAFVVLLIILYLKNIVLRFDIISDDEKTRSDIMDVLAQENVTVGSYIPDIELVEIERALKQRVEGISWAGITRKGNSMIIDVVENIPAPTGSFSRFPTNLIAKENAVVEKVMLLDGQLKTVVGSGVRKGDVIISGTVETRKSSWTDGKESVETSIRYTRSMGVIEGSFERTVVFEQKLDDIVKKETGNIYTQRYLQLFSANIPMFFKAKVGNYYTDESVSTAAIAGRRLPVGIKTLTFREYDYKPVKYTQQQAVELANEKCKNYEINFLKDYQIKNKTVTTSTNEDSVKLQVTYTLYGNICEEAAFFIEK